jgi:UDP-N-acetylglucosamine--N-acetylmuramyl-(pentapeptide) pyrophosphoryl-undecaprenol N-acetylglucosamine transferase
VPFPHAVDDHQTANARFLVDAGAGWLVQQADLTPSAGKCYKNGAPRAVAAGAEGQNMQKLTATREIVAACELAA